MIKSGRLHFNWHDRRKLEVPTIAPFGSVSSESKRLETKGNHLGSSRSQMTANPKPGWKGLGTSFIECTGNVSSASIRAASNSLTNSPFTAYFRSGESKI